MIRVYSACTLGLGIFLSIVAGPSFLRDEDNLTILSEAGITRVLNGSSETESWESLHHLELHCFGGGRAVRPSPDVTLKFDGGRVVPYFFGMHPVGKTRQEALAEFEALRARYGAPIIWRDLSQEMSFQGGSRNIANCVNAFADRFPAGSRAALLEMLSDASGLREQTLNSYK